MKEFLSQYGVPFTVKNVLQDAAARHEFAAAGYLLPPVTVINGVAVAGFVPDRMIDLLEQTGSNDGTGREDGD